MRIRTMLTIAVAGIAVLSMGSGAVSGQSASATSKVHRTWTPPRTPDGQPDLQGIWTNDTATPLERPTELAGKEFFTAEESAAYTKRVRDQFLAQSRDIVHYDDALWQDESYKREASRRTSLITDPRDGKVPPLTPEAEKQKAARADANGRSGSADSAARRTLAERCISWLNVGPPMLPPSYNANLQILQTRDHVVIFHEMIHDVRIIPLDGRPHIAQDIRQLAGDSRGHWEGDTLVVDTTNFSGKTNFKAATRNNRQDLFATEDLHVVERFTRVDSDAIRYEFTVEDPATWTRRWSGEVPITRFEGPILEYACHEGNYGLPNILRAARVLEKQKHEAAK